MKKINLLLCGVLLSSSLIFTGCNDDDDPVTNPSNERRITANITSNTTWNKSKVVILTQRIAVEAGATLTIEAGTIIKGEAGSGANAAALVIAQGATINAEGTATEPIIFTSIADEISPDDIANGDFASPNLDANLNGLWGGVLILGNAPISVKSNADFEQIEGIPPSDPNGRYGGTDAADNSGIFKYVSIRHGGSNIGEGNEINGLTLGGVGTGTQISHVEIVANQDDGIECFGGTVDASNILVWNVGDDQFDMDQAYSGTIDNFIGIAGSETDHMMELDGPEGSRNGAYTLTNGSLKLWNDGGVDGGEYADLRSNCQANLSNIYHWNGSESSDFELDNNGVAQNYLNSLINLSDLQFNVSHLTAGNLTIGEIIVEKADTDNGETVLDVFTTKPLDASNTVVSAASVGADKSAFAGWTWASEAGELTNF